MKVRIPVLTKDPSVARWKGVPMYETYTIDGEDVFLDGPVSRRVAILDFDPRTGALLPGARFVPPLGENGSGSYLHRDDGTLDDPALHQALVFGGVHKTLEMFEEPDALGRRVDWAFDGAQLLVVPRAGEWANAFYERDSRSLQFFFVTPGAGARPVYTSHSQDVIAHETAHAIIDGVVPDLYDAALPQSLALHESLADIATLIMAFRCRPLVQTVLQQTRGSIAQSSAFTAIAEQLAANLDNPRDYLRELNNDATLRSRRIDPTDPHSLSEVLSGALYRTLVDMYDEIRGESDAGAHRGVTLQSEVGAFDATGGTGTANQVKSLWVAGQRLKRMVVRGLDYLPPGEASFADYGRAVLAADEASHPDSPGQRKRLVREFVRRGIVAKAADLRVETNFTHRAVGAASLETLATSDWAAYQFAEENRALLGIPPGPFEVRPRLDVTKAYYHRGREKATPERELLFKVSWTEVEPAAAGAGLPPARRFVRGTTLAVDWATRRVRAVLTTSHDKGATRSREAFVQRLLAEDMLAIGTDACGPDGRAHRNAVLGVVTDGALRLRATARALHLLREDHS